MYDQATIDIFKDLTAITLRFQYQASVSMNMIHLNI